MTGTCTTTQQSLTCDKSTAQNAPDINNNYSVVWDISNPGCVIAVTTVAPSCSNVTLHGFTADPPGISMPALTVTLSSTAPLILTGFNVTALGAAGLQNDIEFKKDAALPSLITINATSFNSLTVAPDVTSDLYIGPNVKMADYWSVMSTASANITLDTMTIGPSQPPVNACGNQNGEFTLTLINGTFTTKTPILAGCNQNQKVNLVLVGTIGGTLDTIVPNLGGPVSVVTANNISVDGSGLTKSGECDDLKKLLGGTVESFTCSSGGGLSGLAIFGIILLVLVVLAILVIVIIVVVVLVHKSKKSKSRSGSSQASRPNYGKPMV